MDREGMQEQFKKMGQQLEEDLATLMSRIKGQNMADEKSPDEVKELIIARQNNFPDEKTHLLVSYAAGVIGDYQPYNLDLIRWLAERTGWSTERIWEDCDTYLYEKHEDAKQDIFVACVRNYVDDNVKVIIIGVYSSPQRAVAACIDYNDSNYSTDDKLTHNDFEETIESGNSIMWKYQHPKYSEFRLTVIREKLDDNLYLPDEYRDHQFRDCPVEIADEIESKA